MAEVTVVGGGIAGLITAITAAEEGARVRLLEARTELGGRARTSPPPYHANLGPHALYTDGAFWQWLETEGLLPGVVTRGDEMLLYRHHGELAPMPSGLGDALAKILAQPAPADVSFREWATSLAGREECELLVGFAWVFSFDYDPGRLAASFVSERLGRVVKPDAVRYIAGGWQALVEQLSLRATQAGVIIETRSRARELPPRPVVVATSPAAARRLLGAHVRAVGTRVGLTDIALASEMPPPSGVLDLDERLYLARYTAFDRGLAPPGEELIQIVGACQPHERQDDVQARIDRLLDQIAPGWRGQLRWSRRSLLADATGALDLPGRDWNSRPAISQGDGLFIAGDYVAAPGLLSEVSFNSGRQAGLAAAASDRRPSARKPHSPARSGEEFRPALDRAAEEIAHYRSSLPTRRVGAQMTRDDVRGLLEREPPEGPTELMTVVEELIAAATPGLTASAGPRYFGFVIGGALDAALIADLLAVGWEQNAFNEVTSPAAIAFEDIAGGWLKELMHIPAAASVGFVTGGQAANTVGLAAGRWSVLQAQGWDVGKDGLQGAPTVRVVVGAERHATIDRAVRLLGLGERALVEVRALGNGAMDPDALEHELNRAPGIATIVCAQAGNVNTGACDDLTAVAAAARSAAAWLHVDGAFGLWAAASPRTYPLVEGIELADSWACDGHKWLNVPYDSGYVFCVHPDVHAAAMAYAAEYLTGQVAGRDFGGGDFTTESSRRARGFATWAALRALGRSGVRDLVERCCALAQRVAEQLDALPNAEVVNDVVLNQVLVRVGDAATTERIAGRLQQDGVCWLGATTWRGERLLRISVSNWLTSEVDVDQTARAIARAMDAS